MELGRISSIQSTEDYSYNTFDPITIGAIGAALSGLGAGVGSIFGFLDTKKQTELAEQQAQYDAYMELQSRKRTTNIILGITTLVILTVGGIIIVRKLR